jgi:hypothetical protein
MSHQGRVEKSPSGMIVRLHVRSQGYSHCPMGPVEPGQGNTVASEVRIMACIPKGTEQRPYRKLVSSMMGSDARSVTTWVAMPHTKMPQDRPRGPVAHYRTRHQLRTCYRDRNGERCHVESTTA